MKNLDTLKNEMTIIELDRTAQKNIIGGGDLTTSSTSTTRTTTDVTGTYFDHEFIEE